MCETAATSDEAMKKVNGKASVFGYLWYVGYCDDHITCYLSSLTLCIAEVDTRKWQWNNA